MCLNPVTIKCADGFHSMQVKCGHCIQCVREYQQTWVTRLSEEYKSWRNVSVHNYVSSELQVLPGAPPVVFFTLTYDENRIPKNFLHLTTTGVHLAKSPLFALPPSNWNTTLKESQRDAKERQENIEKQFKDDLRCYLDTFGDDGDSREFEQDTYDMPAWMFDEQSAPLGKPLSSIVAFNSVRYSDVRNWLKSCRVKYSRKVPSVVLENGKECNPRYVSEIDGHCLPDSALTTSFKYFICSEYGPLTLRPHYHGVMFGVTAAEFRDWFLPLWTFGHVDYSAFDATKGGMMYIAKYCSKGSYDNPLSKKDFFYPSGKEFHSDKWIGSIERFGVNLPLADPCFRLMSHGLGIGYAFRKQTQHYWGVDIDEDFVVRSTEVVSAMPSVDLWQHPNSPLFSKRCSVLRSVRFEGQTNLFDYKVVDSVEGRYRFLSPEENIRFYTVRKFNERGQLLQESVFDTSIKSEYINEDYLLSKRFVRSFVYRRLIPTKAPYAFRQNEAKGEYSLSSKTVESALPRYYHRWLIPPSSKLYISSAAIRRDLASAADEARYIRSLGTTDAKISYSLEKLASEEFLRARATEDLRKSSERFYNRLDLEDRKDVYR